MEFRILGPVELWADGLRCSRGTAKERCVLAVLLLSLGQAVSAEKIMSRVWDDDPPPGARSNLHTYVSRLRGRIHQIADDAWIGPSRSGGYVLEADRETVDLYRSESLWAQARAMADSGDDEQALALHHEAARLWRGDPLADLTGTWAGRTRENLADKLLTATLERTEIELRLGHHADLVMELSELAERHPLNEKIIGLLVVALYRSGRQAEALKLFHDVSHRLHGLGAKPAPDLRELHQRILRGDRTLLPVPRAPGIDVHPLSNLPPDLRFFAGREEEIGDLLPRIDRGTTPVTVMAVDGMPGVGKTVFAVHLAHLLADRYPDGHLYLDLHAYDRERVPLAPGVALDRLLRMIGVSPGRIPRTTNARASLWRAELAHRRVLLILDNAAGHDQVRPLLPGAPGCLTLITSRRRLAGLEDVESASLNVLSVPAASALLRHAVGPARRLGDQDVREMVRLCGQLPMALQFVGNRLRHRPTLSVAELAERLAEGNRRLAEIRAEDREITAAFELSYRGLDNRQRQAFRRLGLHPGLEFTRHSAAAALDTDSARAERILDDLIDHHLVIDPVRGRYRIHDLIRDYACQLAQRTDPDVERRDTVRRILDHYLSTADRADRLLYPRRRRAAFKVSELPDPVPLATSDQARDWLEDELHNLLEAAEHPGYGSSFSYVLANHLEARGHWETAAQLHERAILEWRRQENSMGTAEALSDLSLVRFRSGQYAHALEHAEAALDIYRSLEDRKGEADILDLTGLIHWQQSRYGAALACSRRALAISLAIGNRRSEALILDHTAIYLEYIGRFREAIDHRRRALTIYAAINDAHGRQMAANNMGDLKLKLGQVESALSYYKEAAVASPRMGRQHEAIWLNNMAKIHRHTDQHDEALRGFRKALQIYREIGDRRSAIETIINIGLTFQARGHFGEAFIHYQNALTMARDISERYEEVRALQCIGDALLHTGRYTHALERFQESIDLADELGTPIEKARALEGLGSVLLHTRGRSDARKRWKQALRLYQGLGTEDTERVRNRLRTSDHAAGS